MKKTIVVLAVVVVTLVAVAAFTGVASAQTTQPGQGTLHDYMEKAMADARRLNRGLEIFAVSAKTGEGLDAWCAWLKEQCRNL